MRTETREQYVALLSEALHRRYGDACEGVDIESEVRHEYDGLCDGSRVPDFVPILAERRARRRLSAICGKHDAVRAGAESEDLAVVEH
jgi:hypothetical protein